MASYVGRVKNKTMQRTRPVGSVPSDVCLKYLPTSLEGRYPDEEKLDTRPRAAAFTQETNAASLARLSL